MKLQSALPCMALGLLIGPLSAQQVTPAAPSAKDLLDANTDCKTAPDLILDQLETNQKVLAAANGLAVQIDSLYDSNDPSTAPTLSDSWGHFHFILLQNLKSVCVAQSATATKAKQAANATATTSQTNTQVGTTGSSTASTSATQKVGIPELLGIAVEDGAVTNSVTGTTMTLSTTPYGFFTAFGKDEDTQSNWKTFALFRQLGISATFNIASTSNPLASATRKQVSNWQIKGTFRDTSTRSSEVNTAYKTILLPEANALVADESNSVLGTVYRQLAVPADAAYKTAWTTTLQSAESTAPVAADTTHTQKRAALAMQLLQILDKDAAYQSALAKLQNTGDLAAIIQRSQTDEAAYTKAQTAFAKQIADIPKGWNGAISLSQQFPTSTTTPSTTTTASTPHMPDYLVGELDITCDPKTVSTQRVPCILPKTSLTANFSGSFYTQPSTALNETTFRGAQTSIQFQWNLGPGFVKAAKTANDDSKMTLSLSGNYQRLQENKDKASKRPDIVLGNIKLEIPISSGVSLPLSFSVANATSQIKETYVKGDFGLSFDLDKLASLLKANH